MKKSLLVAFSILLLSACTTTRLSDEAMGTLIEDFIASEQIENRHSVSAFTLDSYGELNDELFHGAGATQTFWQHPE